MEQTEEQKPDPTGAINHFARQDLAAFAVAMNSKYQLSWHHDNICQALERVERGEIKLLLIFMPPRHGKSELASVNFPAWYLGRNPDKSIIQASYVSDLAVDFGRKVRNMMISQEYQGIFRDDDNRPITLAEDSQAAGRFNTNKKGSYFAVGVGGPTTGRGADVLLIDDPVKDRETADSPVMQKKVIDWWSAVVQTRLEKGGAQIVIMTRWNENDLAGHILGLIEAGAIKEPYEILNLPALAIGDEENRKEGEALWPEKYDTQALLNLKARMKPRDWLSLYQQTPSAQESQEFFGDWFKYYEDHEKPEGMLILTAVDPAFTKKKESDFCAIITVGLINDKMYLLDYVNKKFGPDPARINDAIIDQARKWRPYKIGVEAFAAQVMLAATLRTRLQLEGLPIEVLELRIPNHKDSNVQKQRIRSLVPKYRDGKVFHKRWMTELEDQLIKFPTGKWDDLADCLSFFDHFNIKMTVIPQNPDKDYFSSMGIDFTPQYNDFGEPI